MNNANIIKLNLTHSNLQMKVPETRFDLNETIAHVKSTCEKKFGTSTVNMQLILQDANGNSVAALNEDDRTLSHYCPQQGYTIHVIDLDPHSITKDLEDVTQVEKYTMTEEEYDKLPNSFRKFKANYMKAQEAQAMDNQTGAEAPNLIVGSRCCLIEQGHRGTIKFVGMVPEMGEGWFVGVELDLAYGTNDGSIQGNKYFECAANHGTFLKPNKVEMGNFPKIDDDDEI